MSPDDIAAALRDLGAQVEIYAPGDAGAPQAIDITGVTHDSRLASPTTLFACLPGDHVDGHDFAGAAVAAGTPALLVERRLDVDVIQLVVDGTRRWLGPVASLLSGSPSRQLTSVGITGTNGKTTTSLMLAAIFEHHGWQTGVIGTLSGPRTTPEAPELQQRLATFVERGDDAAVLEVSSHALALHRIDGTEFDAVVFTNFGRDHLDLHGTPEAYFRAKASLFSSRFAPLAVINLDDTHGRLLIDVLADGDDDIRVVPYCTDDVADVVVTAGQLDFDWRGEHVQVPIGGSFNVSNALAALVTACELGVAPATAVSGLAVLPTVPGRFESVEWTQESEQDHAVPGFSVIVDYAHTPDGLDEVLAAARSVVDASAAVIVVFGCGGDRDQAKRPEMGAVAAAAADRVFVTSDNPRTEDPQAIIDDVIGGVPDRYRDRVMSEPDRRAAIGAALRSAADGDIVVIAGKGHEQTQDFGHEVIEFDDRTVARDSWLADRTGL